MKMLYKSMLLLIAMFAIQGCGSTNGLMGKQDIDFAMVTETKSGGTVSYFTGQGDICKVTTSGDIRGWKVSFKGNKCQAKFDSQTVSGEPLGTGKAKVDEPDQ